MKSGWTMNKNAHEIVAVAVSATALSAGTRTSHTYAHSLHFRFNHCDMLIYLLTN